MATQFIRPIGFIILLVLVLGVTPQSSAAWPADVVVTNAPGRQEEPEIVTDGAGGAIVFWRDRTDGPWSPNAPVYARRVLASGVPDPAWPEHGLKIFEGEGWFRGNSILPDGMGGVFVGWASGDSRHVRVQHVLSNGTFDPAWPTGGRVVRGTDATISLYTPSLLSDGASGIIVAWPEVSSTPSASAYRAQHLDAAGTIDPAWPVDGTLVLPCACASSMVTDHAGGAVFAAGPSSTGSDTFVVNHLKANGTLDATWPTGGRTLGPAGDGSGIIGVSDGAGGVILVWTDYSRPVAGYAQHILANGSVDPAWPAAAVAYGQNSSWLAAVDDGAGGVISTWLNWDYKGPNAFFVHGQRILDEGALDSQWPASGLYVADTDNDSPDGLRAISDGAGGAIVAFVGYRFFGVIRVLSSGAVDPSWPANGWRSEDHFVRIPAIVLDGVGGVIVAWALDSDIGPYNIDIHAQRISLSGATTSVPALRVGPEPILARVTPTPTRGTSAIDFTMPVAGRVALTIHDVGGRKVCDLLRAEVAAGAHSVTWSGSVEGRRAPNGIYFVRMETSSGLLMRRLVLLR